MIWRLALLSAAVPIVLTACAAPRSIPDSAEIQPRVTRPSEGAAGAPAQPGGEREARASQSAATDAGLPRLDRMVITNLNLTLSVDDAVEASRGAERVAERYGGFVAASNVRDSGQRREATLTLRVPASSLSLALTDLRGLGNRVTDESRTTQDVTEEYTDVESNLRNYRATETQLLALMERATRIEDIMAIQRELTNVRGQIERLEGRRRALENQGDLATISLRLTEVAVSPRDGWSPAEDLAQALATLARFAQRLGTIAIWAVVFFPLYGLPPLLIWWLVRRLRPARPVTTG